MNPFSFTTAKKGTRYYYSSARFRELQLDYVMNNREMPLFPTERNFFLGRYNDAMLYTSLIDKRDTYYNMYDIDSQNLKGDKEGKYGAMGSFLRRNFNVTHVYRSKRDLRLFEIMNRDNIKRLLFDDEESPFHISYAHIRIHDSEDIRLHIKSSRTGRKFAETHNLPVDKGQADHCYGGFLTLVAATNYFDQQLTRYSSYSFDFVLIHTLIQYFRRKGIQCDGWYQPKVGDFHVEWAFFDPRDCLMPDLDHQLSWTSVLKQDGIDISNMSLHKKEQTRLRLVERWREQEEAKALAEVKRYEDGIQQLTQKGEDSDFFREYEEDITSATENLGYAKAKLESIRSQPVTDKDIAIKLLGYKAWGPKKFKGGEVESYVNKQILACQHGSCKNPLRFSACQDKMDKLVDEMDLYPNANNNHHVGQRVSDHTIWVTRAMHRWLGYRDHPWTIDLDNGVRNLALASAFLHDIGKVGDADVQGLSANGVKTEHPHRGYEYLTKLTTFKGTDSKESKVLKEVLSDCRMEYNKMYLATIATAAAMHHHLGEFLMSILIYSYDDVQNNGYDLKLPYVMQRTEQIYLSHRLSATVFTSLLNTIIEFKYVIYMFDFLRHYHEAGGDIYKKAEVDQALKIVLAVSAADVYGAHPVENHVERDSIYEVSLVHLMEPKFLQRNTLRHTEGTAAIVPEIFRPYYTYLYYTLGLRERNMLLLYADTIVDPGAFLDAWYNWRGLTKHIENPSKRLPTIFGVLDMTSAENFITELFRLIKSGVMPDTPRTPVRRIPETIINELKETYTLTDNPRAHPLIAKFYKHRHPELVRQAPEIFGQGRDNAAKTRRAQQAPF